MQDTGLLLSLAEIAGVFVGFAALISVRGGGAADPHEIVYMRAVVWMGLMAVVAALAPVTIRGYDLAEHQVWMLSSILVLAGYFGMVAISVRAPERRADETETSRGFQVVETAFSALWAIVTILGLGAIVLGLVPELEAALYSTVVVLILLGSAGTLLELVFRQRRPASA